MSGSANPAALSEAVSALQLQLRRRRWALRVLHLLAGAVLVVALPLPILARWAGGAALLLLLPGIWVLYLLVDTALVLVWRRRVLRAWRGRAINLGVLAEAVATLPNLPRASVEAVLRGLPALPPLRDHDLEADVRIAIAAFSDWRWTEETVSALMPSILLGIPSVCGSILLMTATPPTMGVVAIVTVLFVVVVAARLGLPLERKRRLMRTLVRMVPERRAAVLTAARDLDWSGTSDSRRARMLRALERNCRVSAGA